MLFLAMVILVARLAWLQIVNAKVYLEKAEQSLDIPPKWINTLRGQILDCQKRPLAIDQPSFDIALHYNRLIRLYDQRFWEAKVESLTSKKHNQNMTTTEAWDNVEAELRNQLCEADMLLEELSQICGVTIEQILEKIDRINEKIHILRSSMARRAYYRRLSIPCVPATGEAIFDDFVRVVAQSDQAKEHCDNQQERIAWSKKHCQELIGKTKSAEMDYCHSVLKNVPEYIAMDVELYFVGRFLGAPTGNRPVTVTFTKTRTYPYKDASCHIIGQLGPILTLDPNHSRPRHRPNATELSDYYIGDRCGDWGIEQIFETHLRGSRGWLQENVDRRQGQRIDPIPGKNITITIDIELQKRIKELFLAKGYARGAAVVIDVPTGYILAAVSLPAFDLNTFYHFENFHRATSELYWHNRALEVRYMPGSTIKPTVLLAGLTKGVVNKNTTLNCPPRDEAKPKPQCWSIPGHGDIAAYEAIRQSCNMYFIRLGQLLGPEYFVSWFKQMGFGSRSLAWPNQEYQRRAITALRETTGHIAPLNRNMPTRSQLRFISIGRGPIDGSALQIANTVATIARGAVVLSPTLLIDPSAKQTSTTVCHDKAAIGLVQRAMRAVVYEKQGTAYEAFSPPPWSAQNVAIYGKTGSTDVSLFACFARENSQPNRCLALAVIVEVDNPSDAHGGEQAAPLANDILRACGLFGYLPKPD